MEQGRKRFGSLALMFVSSLALKRGGKNEEESYVSHNPRLTMLACCQEQIPNRPRVKVSFPGQTNELPSREERS